MYKKMLKILRSEKGEVYVGEGVKIVLCVVLGAAMLAGLVLMANKVILPKTGIYLESMFNSADGSAAYLEWDSNGRYNATSVVRMAFMKNTDWSKKKAAGAYDSIAGQTELNLLDEIIRTGKLTISANGRTVSVPADELVDEMRGNLNDSDLTPEQKQLYQDFVSAYDYARDPEVKRKMGTMEIEIERKLGRVEDNVYKGYIAKYGGTEEAFENYLESLPEAEQEALGLEYEEKVIQGYRDVITSTASKYGVEYTEEELNEIIG